MKHLKKISGVEHLCEHCGFECKSDEPCVFGDIVTCLGRLKSIEARNKVEG